MEFSHQLWARHFHPAQAVDKPWKHFQHGGAHQSACVLELSGKRNSGKFSNSRLGVVGVCSLRMLSWCGGGFGWNGVFEGCVSFKKQVGLIHRAIHGAMRRAMHGVLHRAIHGLIHGVVH